MAILSKLEKLQQQNWSRCHIKLKKDDRVINVAEFNVQELNWLSTSAMLSQEPKLPNQQDISIVAQCLANDSVQCKEAKGTRRGGLSQQAWVFSI